MIITKKPDGSFDYSGYAVDAVKYMAELFQFKYKKFTFIIYHLLTILLIKKSYSFV